MTYGGQSVPAPAAAAETILNFFLLLLLPLKVLPFTFYFTVYTRTSTRTMTLYDIWWGATRAPAAAAAETIREKNGRNAASWLLAWSPWHSHPLPIVCTWIMSRLTGIVQTFIVGNELMVLMVLG